MTGSKKSDAEAELDDQALDDVTGGARSAGAAGEAAAGAATRKKKTGEGTRSDLDDLEVER